jgi:hypothetical protein
LAKKVDTSSFKERYWLTQIRFGKVPSFPRDIHIPRSTVSSKDSFVTIAKFTNNKPDSTAVYSDWEITNHTASTIFIDIDGEDITDSLKFLSLNYALLRKLRANVMFTGNRGFHIYIPIKPTRVEDLRSATRFVIELFNGDTDRYVDHQKVGDWREMGRLPYTVNEKSGNLSQPYPIKPSSDSSENINELSKILSQFSRPISTYKIVSTIQPPESVQVCGIPPPCIVYCLEHMRSGSLTHPQRFHLANFLSKIMSVDEVCKVFECERVKNGDSLGSPVPSLILRNVRDLAERGYYPYRCDTARILGVCPIPEEQEICPYYPSITKQWMRR